MKAKTQTLVQKESFKDSDRTPKHDEIQIYVMGNIWKVFNNLYLDDIPINSKNFTHYLEIEVPVTTGKNKFTVGFIDVTVILHNKKSNKSYSIGIEIKSTIDSFGDLVRQINMYRQHTAYSFCVVSPDDRYKKQLSSQGIGFIKYER